MAARELNTVLDLFPPAFYARFTEGALTTDTSAGGHTLTAIGVPVDGTPMFGGAVGLGTSQAFSAVDHANFQPAGNFSVSGWVRSVYSADTHYIFQSFSANTNQAGLFLQVIAGGKVLLFSGKNTGVGATHRQYHVSTNTVNNGAWHHVVGTYDGAKLHVYIDGAEEGTGTAWTNAAAFAATNYVRVGCNNDAGTNAWFFRGSLDEVSFFPSDALSLAQVQSLYANSINHADNSAIKALASAIYLFEDGAMLTDTTANAHTLTAIGTPTQLTTKFGGSIFLGNSSAYSSVDHADFQPTGNFTVGAWVKTNDSSGNFGIFQSGSRNTEEAGWRLQTSGNKLEFIIGKNTGQVLHTDYESIASTTILTDGNWHFATITWDGSYLRLYFDGISDATPVSMAYAPVYAATNYVRVGGRVFTGAMQSYFPGQLDDVFLLNGTALDASDVYYLATGTRQFSFLGDTNLIKTIESSFKGDSSLKNTIYGDFKGDSNLLKVISTNFNGDSNLKKVIQSSFTGNTSFLKSISAQFLADASLVKTLSSNQFTGDTSLKKIISDSFLGDSALMKVLSNQILGNSNLLKTIESSFKADASLIKQSISNSFVGDGNLIKVFSNIFNGDTNLLKTIEQSLTGDASLIKFISNTLLGDSNLLKNIQSSFTADAVLLKAISNTILANTNLTKVISDSFTGNATLWKFIQSSFVGDASLKKTFQSSFTVDSNLWKFLSNTFTGIGNLLKTIIMSGRWRYGEHVRYGDHVRYGGKGLTADANLKKTFQGSFTGDANLFRYPGERAVLLSATDLVPTIDTQKRASATIGGVLVSPHPDLDFPLADTVILISTIDTAVN